MTTELVSLHMLTRYNASKVPEKATNILHPVSLAQEKLLKV